MQSGIVQIVGQTKATIGISTRISHREGLKALEEIEEIIFGRNRTEARAGGRKNLVARKDNPYSLEEKKLFYAEHLERELSEGEKKFILKKFEILQKYFEQNVGFMISGWRMEKQAMRIKMILLIVRTKVKEEFFMPD